MEKTRSIQAFFLGIALWLVSLAIFTIPKENDEENSKKNSLLKKFNCLTKLVTLAFILPFGVVAPFLGSIISVDGIWLCAPSFNYITYSLIFAAVFVIAYIVLQIYKNNKKRNL